MIKVKHLMDAIEPDDGQRIWVEPVRLTSDLRDWCRVDEMLCQFGPPTALSEWFEEHQDGYDFFRAQYHEALACGLARACPHTARCAFFGVRDDASPAPLPRRTAEVPGKWVGNV